MATFLPIALLLLAGPVAAHQNGQTPDYAFVTIAEGRVANACWVEPDGNSVRLHNVLNRSKIIDVTVRLRADGTCSESSVILQDGGLPPGKPILRTFSSGVVYWSDMVASSIEQVIKRARAIGGAAVTVEVGSFYRDGTETIPVTRISSTRWHFDIHSKHYDVVSDDQGNVQSAMLPEFGTVIERRRDFKQSQLQPWPVHGTPIDGHYQAKDVTIKGPRGQTIAGTLTVPSDPKGAVPAAVLIGGLGGGNRNGGSPPWMPLRDISDQLSRAGLAVLRVDTEEDTNNYTIEKQNQDIAAEIKWLRSQPHIKPNHVILVGYSAGSLCALEVSAADARIAGVVSLAGSGVPGPELAEYQTRYRVTGDPSIAPADREAEIKKQLADNLTPRESSFLSIDPLLFARKVRCPLLILQGATDKHVPLFSAELLGNAARSGGNEKVEVEYIPGVSHSLLADPSGLDSGWLYLPSHATSPRMLTRIAAWLRLNRFVS